jgi:hypothetical protein
LGCELKARATNTQIEKLFSFTIASVIEQWCRLVVAKLSPAV